jgi:hypothetical protein
MDEMLSQYINNDENTEILSENVTIGINVSGAQGSASKGTQCLRFAPLAQGSASKGTQCLRFAPLAKPQPSEVVENECPICYNKVMQNNSTTTLCGHTFHSSCLFKCVAKNINTCPSCRKHLYKKEIPMEELYKQVKDEIFNFDTFCYIINMIDYSDINKCITDYDKYEDDNDDDDDDDEQDNNQNNSANRAFNLCKHESKMIDTINSFLENNLDEQSDI